MDETSRKLRRTEPLIFYWSWSSNSEITTYTTLDGMRISALGHASVDVAAKRIWLTKSSYGAGLVVLNGLTVSLSQSFAFNFKWNVLSSEDDADGDGYDEGTQSFLRYSNVCFKICTLLNSSSS